MSYRAQKYQNMSEAVKKFKNAGELCDQLAKNAMEVGSKSLNAECKGDKAFKAYIDVRRNRQRIAALWWVDSDKKSTAKAQGSGGERATGPSGSGGPADGNDRENDQNVKAVEPERAADNKEEATAQEDAAEEDQEAKAVEEAATQQKEQRQEDMDLRSFVQSLPATERPVTSITTFYTWPQLAAFSEKILVMDSAVLIEAAVEEFKQLAKTTEQWIESYTKSANDIGGYLSGKSRQAANDEEKQKKDAEKAEIKAAKDKAKEASKTLKSQEQLKGAIFNIDSNQFLSVPEVTVLSLHSRQADMSKPWIVRQSDEVVQYKDIPSMVLRLSEYGGSYKKSGHVFKEEGRTQQPMAAREGKEETDVMFSKFLPEKCAVDLSSLAFGASFMQIVWLFGYAHDFVGCFLTPNAASMLKVLAHGQVKLVAFAVSTLAEHFGSQHIDELAKSLLKMKSEDVAEISNISQGFTAVVTAGDVFHIPAGWLVCEQSSQGALIYGVRKSWIPVSHESCVQYKAVLNLLKKSGRQVDKMEQVLDLMEKA